MSTNVPDASRSDLRALIARVVAGERLSMAEAEAAFTAMMEGRATAVQMAALLVGLRVRGEAADELAGGARALRCAMVRVETGDGVSAIDTCGTGGGTLTTFNISTAAALVAAGAGARIAKHGNRSFTSRCGSADVLEALGVAITLTPEAMAAVLERAGIVFMFAPLLHPAMRHVGPIRGELGVPTVMNLLGPLANPAGVRRQVVGVPDRGLLDLVASALQRLEPEHALVVHGEPGLDELSPLGASEIVELQGGHMRRYRFDPGEAFGWRGFEAAELVGGTPEQNARLIADVLTGRREGAARAAVVLNAGAALYVAGMVASLEDGAAEAERTLDAGAAMGALERLREASQEAGAAGA